MNSVANQSKKVKILTWGCQMNLADSGNIGGVLKREGYQLTEDESKANIILLNTCSVRELAEDKVFSKLGELGLRKKRQPGLVIGICGCMATQHKEGIFERAPYIDLLCGPRSVAHLPKMLSDLMGGVKPRMEIDENEAVPALLPSERDSSFKAWVSVTQGCDERCTFCVVPNTRGDQASRRPEDIVAEVRDLAARGYKEVTLLGQTVNAYGLDLPQPIPFSELIRQIHAVDGIEWIRFVTSHVRYATTDFIEMFGALPKVCPYLHLPYQSGSDKILRRMGRRYTVEEYLKTIAALRSVRPDIALSTDVIVGFPGEMEEDFAETLRVFEKAQFDGAFCFKYSPRPNTPALKLEDNIPLAVKKERLERLLELFKKVSFAKKQQAVGQTRRVLLEEPSDRNPNRLMGRDAWNNVVAAEAPAELIGRFADVEIFDATVTTLYGRCVN